MVFMKMGSKWPWQTSGRAAFLQMYPSILLNHSPQKKACYGDVNVWMLLPAKWLKQRSHLQEFYVHVKHSSIVLWIYFCVSSYQHGGKRGGERNSSCSHPIMHSGRTKPRHQNWSIPDCTGSHMEIISDNWNPFRLAQIQMKKILIENFTD